jgi:H+/gluconate symporter-like permease
VVVAVKSFFFLLLFGNIQSYIYRESGAAYSIAATIMNRLIKENAGNTAKNMIAMAIILIIGFVLNMGGIIAGVVIVLMYPIALAIFERCDIPKKFILGVLGAGSYTFT